MNGTTRYSHEASAENEPAEALGLLVVSINSLIFDDWCYDVCLGTLTIIMASIVRERG